MLRLAPSVGLWGGQRFLVDGADFDGTNDYMTRGAGLTGAVDSKLGILSMWLRMDGGDGVHQWILVSTSTVGGSAVRFRLARPFTNRVQIIAVNAANSIIMQVGSVSEVFVSGGGWHHFLASWDMAGVPQIYVDDVSSLTQTTFTNDTIDYTSADWSVAANADGTEKLNGCLTEVYFAPGQYLDFSVEANRRKFINSALKPVKLGDDGSLPTGTAPLVYQHLSKGEAVANFATNRGSGGNFTITGTLDTASTSPSD